MREAREEAARATSALAAAHAVHEEHLATMHTAAATKQTAGNQQLQALQDEIEVVRRELEERSQALSEAQDRASGAEHSARSMEKIRPLQTVLQRPTALRYQAEIRRSDLFWHLADLRPPPRFAFATSTRHSGHDISRDVRDRHDVRRRRQGRRAPLQPRHLQTGAPATPIAPISRLSSRDCDVAQKPPLPPLNMQGGRRSPACSSTTRPPICSMNLDWGSCRFLTEDVAVLGVTAPARFT